MHDPVSIDIETVERVEECKYSRLMIDTLLKCNADTDINNMHTDKSNIRLSLTSWHDKLISGEKE